MRGAGDPAMNEPNENGRKRRRRLVVIGVPFAALALVLALLAAGVARRRLEPTAVFLAVAAAASLAQLAAGRLSSRRARRLRAREVPWGVRLDRPWWLSTPEVAVALEIGAMLAALLALCGAPGIGAGVLLTFAAIGLGMPMTQSRMAPRALTFEDGGLRVHVSAGAFLVPWSAITAVETVGPDHMQFTTLRLTDREAIEQTITPDTPRMRERVGEFFREAGSGGKLLLLHWTGGLDGQTLARTLEVGRHGHVGRVN
jgi:hypothetical protein